MEDHESFSSKLSLKNNELREKVVKVVETYNEHKSITEKFVEDWKAAVQAQAETIIAMIDEYHDATMAELDQKMQENCAQISQLISSVTKAEEDLVEFKEGMNTFVKEMLN